MALAHNFSYARPQSITEALELLKTHRETAKILAGGTDLIVNIKEGMSAPQLLIDIKDIKQLNNICQEAGFIQIGAGVTFTQLLEDPLIKQHFIILHDAAATVASTGIRNRATLAGNICTAVPSLDSAPALLCYNAILHCASATDTREIPIEEWFLAPRKTALQPDEILTHIRLPIPAQKSSGIYVKLGRYNGEDLAQAGWGIFLSENNQYRIAHCALAPVPKRARRIETALNGKELSAHIIDEVIALIDSEICPITDIRSSKEYRLHISKVMVKRGLHAAIERFKGNKVEPKAILGGFA
ncbi:MAG: xanthine dehydrogenase family protein subunit M [Candidatus Cloacimonetes bacterium]|nr:xanthine dehydrogenase family protein subunit M [Candidatus Cloacimonadota bacterium]